MEFDPETVRKFESMHQSGEGCWEWTRARLKSGYGKFWDSFSKTHYLAHRASWSIHNERPIPEGMIVMHACDNPPCVNPDHLVLGTQADNMADMVSKERWLSERRKMTFQREKNPTQLPVQMNIKVPWQLREDIIEIARRRSVSLSKLTRDALVKGMSHDLAELGRERTREAGATS